MSFGENRGFSEWSLGEEDAGPFFRQAFELGITLWDTANVCQHGSSEEIVGKAITTYAQRDAPTSRSCQPASDGRVVLALVAVFVIAERRAAQPIMPLRLFRSRGTQRRLLVRLLGDRRRHEGARTGATIGVTGDPRPVEG